MAADRKQRLGRGLESLLGNQDIEGDQASAVAATGEIPVNQVEVTAIRPNPMQPRVGFREREMAELIDSVRDLGILQPLLVRPAGDGFELIAGERRLRAAREVGLATVPAICRETTDDEMLTLALVENLQREDLNPIEKAKGFQRLIVEHGLTQDAASQRLGKSRSTISNFLRLLDLPDSVQHVVARGAISEGHARALLGLVHPSAQQALALRIENEGLSVRETEQIVAEQRGEKKSTGRARPRLPKDPHIRDVEDRMRERLGTKVMLDYREGKGKLTIMLYSDDDLQRCLDALGLSSE